MLRQIHYFLAIRGAVHIPRIVPDKNLADLGLVWLEHRLYRDLYAGRRDDEVLHAAADVLCQDLRRRLTGERPSDRYFRQVTGLGEAIAEGHSKLIGDAPVDEILMRY